jgi:hypothetical protein
MLISKVEGIGMLWAIARLFQTFALKDLGNST